MKRLKMVSLLASFLLPAMLYAEAAAGMTTVFGPAYVHKGKANNRQAEFVFTAPVTGAGHLVIKNGGSAGKAHRVSSAEVRLNGSKIAGPEDFNKNADTLEYTVTLLGENALKVEMGSCNECELEITVLGEALLPERLPTR